MSLPKSLVFLSTNRMGTPLLGRRSDGYPLTCPRVNGVSMGSSRMRPSRFMAKPSDARESPRLPVTYSDLDIGVDGEFRELKMWVSGVKAKGYISLSGWSSRINILFEEPQSLFRDQEFVTKHFDLVDSGHLVWGTQGENLWILEHRE